MQTINKT